MTTEMVDWGLAVTLGSRLAGAGPVVSRTRRPRRWPSCARARTGRRRTSASSPASRRGERRRRSSSSTGRPGSRRTPTGSPRCSPRSIDKMHGEEGPARAGHPGRRLADHRRRGRRPARLHGEQGARPVRPLPRARTAGCCWSRPTSSTSSASSTSTRRLPALGLPARGDPPRAVHRGAVDARPPVRRRSAQLAETVEPQRLLDDGLAADRRGDHAAAASGSLLDLLGTPGAEGDPRPGDRRDVAARGPCRRRDGRRRAPR